MTATEKMLVIKALDPQAHLALSIYTRRWYVSARLDIGNGTLVGGLTQHRDTPDEAVDAYFAELTGHGLNEYVTNNRDGDERRNWEWNGGAFVEVTTDWLRAKYAVGTNP